MRLENLSMKIKLKKGAIFLICFAMGNLRNFLLSLSLHLIYQVKSSTFNLASSRKDPKGEFPFSSSSQIHPDINWWASGNSALSVFTCQVSRIFHYSSTWCNLHSQSHIRTVICCSDFKFRFISNVNIDFYHLTIICILIFKFFSASIKNISYNLYERWNLCVY